MVSIGNWRVEKDMSGKWVVYAPTGASIASFDRSLDADLCANKIRRAVAQIVEAAVLEERDLALAYGTRNVRG